jgi:hypothetical protein
MLIFVAPLKLTFRYGPLLLQMQLTKGDWTGRTIFGAFVSSRHTRSDAICYRPTPHLRG